MGFWALIIAYIMVLCFAVFAAPVIPPEIRATNEEGRDLWESMTPADKALMYKVPILVDPRNNYEKLSPVEMTDQELKWYKEELTKRRQKQK